MCEEVAYRDSACLTVLFTETAADTSYFTDTHECFSLFVGVTLNESLLLIRYQLDQVFRTGRNTFAAGLAGFFVYDRDSVHDVDRIERAGSYTGAIAKAAEGAAF